MRERSGCSGGRQAQIMDTFASSKDQRADSLFLSGKRSSVSDLVIGLAAGSD